MVDSMATLHNPQIATLRPVEAKKRRPSFLKAAAARAANPQYPAKRRRSIIPRGLKSELPRAYRTYEERYQTLFILSNRNKFWAKVNKTDSCWLWTGAKADHGYGQFSSCDIHILAHRYAFILQNGPVAKGLHLHHACETPLCVNPDHVQALTPKEHKAAHRQLNLHREAIQISTSLAAPGFSLAGQAIRGQEKAGEPNSLSPFNEFSGGAA
jgi:hypothetical protein